MPQPIKHNVQLWVKVDSKTAEKLLRIAQDIGMSRAGLMRMILKRKLQDHKNLNLKHLVLKLPKKTK